MWKGASRKEESGKQRMLSEKGYCKEEMGREIFQEDR